MWLDVDDIPLDRYVDIISLSGIRCEAKVQKVNYRKDHHAKAHRHGPGRGNRKEWSHCKSILCSKRGGGDIRARAWKEINDKSK